MASFVGTTTTEERYKVYLSLCEKRRIIAKPIENKYDWLMHYAALTKHKQWDY